MFFLYFALLLLSSVYTASVETNDVSKPGSTILNASNINKTLIPTRKDLTNLGDTVPNVSVDTDSDDLDPDDQAGEIEDDYDEEFDKNYDAQDD